MATTRVVCARRSYLVGMEFDRSVRTVAKRLVLRLTAPAERHPIARLVGNAVGGGRCDPAAQPNRSATVFCGIFDQPDRNRQVALERPWCRFVPGDEAPGRTIIDLLEKRRADFRIVGARHLPPHFAVRIAEARKGAETFCIGEHHCGSFDGLRLLDVRFAVRRLGAVEADLGMGAVAERLVVRMSAPAQRVFLRRWKRSALPPRLRATVRIGADCLLRQRHAAGDDVGTVL